MSASTVTLTLLAIFGSAATLMYGMATHAQRMATRVSQDFGMGGGGGPRRQDHVHLANDALSVQAGQPMYTELRFSIDPGFHINSHKPLTEFMIPTTVTFSTGDAARVLDTQYPRGESFELRLNGGGGAGEALSVYQGELRVGLRMLSPRGSSTLTGTLHYQACDAAACFPPRTLPFAVAVQGR